MTQGTIVSFDGADGLGDIRLDDGVVVRYTTRSLQGVRNRPGTRVEVHELARGFAGRLRAGRVTPIEEVLTPIEVMERILASPESKSPEIAQAYGKLDFDAKLSFGRKVLDRNLSYRHLSLVRAVPLVLWTRKEILWALRSLLAENGVFDIKEFTRFAAAGRDHLADDAELRGLEAQAARSRDIDQADHHDPSAKRPDFDAIEKLFAVKIPRELCEAWMRSYEVEKDPYRFERARTLRALQTLARCVTDEHVGLGELHPIDGLPFPVLPFASARSSDVYVLDLSRPSGDGDYPVLYVPHDCEGAIKEKATTSAEWLVWRGGKRHSRRT